MHERYEVRASEITELVRDLALKANMLLPDGLKKLIRDALNKERMPIARQAFTDILENAELAEEKN
ncbi:MAG TPA: fumarate hydratase, partial [Synergistaceae bacterium]|nr:fumarate hydratase [Synergistaceae bacterium]